MMFLLFFLTKLNIIHLTTQSYENQLGKTKLNDKKRKKERTKEVCTYVLLSSILDIRTQGHKADAMNLSKINFCHSAHYVFLSKPSLARIFFRGGIRWLLVVVLMIELFRQWGLWCGVFLCRFRIVDAEQEG